MVYTLLLIVLKFIISIYIIWTASKNFDLAASYISINLPKGIKGPTINAVASSLPELLISSLFLFYYDDITGFSAGYATIIGSAAFNICVIPVLASWFYFRISKSTSLRINKVIIFQDSIFNLISIIFLGIAFLYGSISIFTSLVLISIYLIYIYFVFKFRTEDQSENNETSNLKDGDTIKRNKTLTLNLFSFFDTKIDARSSIIVLVLSLLLISISCHILTISCEQISSLAGINLFYVSFFIAAIASSIPDTFLSIYDAKNDKIDDAFSNAFGSNIFDICIGLGLPLFIYVLLNGNISLEDSVNSTRLSSYSTALTSMNSSYILLLHSIILLFILSFVTSLIYCLGRFNKFKSILVLFSYGIFLYFLLLI
jgi:cation:H+ antiporter